MSTLSYSQSRVGAPAVAITLALLSTIFLSVRMYARFTVRPRRLGIEDAFIFLGWVFGLALAILIFISAAHYGSDHEKALVTGWLCELFFVIGTSFVKLACMLFYLRIMNPYHIRPIIWAIRAGIAFIISYAFIFVVLNLATCRPFWARWQRMNGEWALTHNFTCMDDGLVGPVSAALSAISDAYTVIVPLVILLRLNLPFRAKIGPYTVFAFGFIAVGAGIARTVYLVRVYQGAPGSVWLGLPILVYSLCEQQVALCCACAPSLRQIFVLQFKPILQARLAQVKALGSKQSPQPRQWAGSNENKHDHDRSGATSPNSERGILTGNLEQSRQSRQVSGLLSCFGQKRSITGPVHELPAELPAQLESSIAREYFRNEVAANTETQTGSDTATINIVHIVDAWDEVSISALAPAYIYGNWQERPHGYDVGRRPSDYDIGRRPSEHEIV